MNKLVVIIADGLRAESCRMDMGYVQSLVKSGRARSTELQCELPSLSRPLYATLMTGLTPVEHGIVSNRTVARSAGKTVFELLHAQGRTSVVAAYHWFRELLDGKAFEPIDRHRSLPEVGIVAAHWYFVDDYPDSHTFADAEAERLAHRPDLVWIHPMGPDNAGHRHGGFSAEYRYVCLGLDAMLALQVPVWHADGYDVLLTSDHGMHADRMHGGAREDETQVPVVWIPRQDDRKPLPVEQTGVRDFIFHHLLGS